MRVIFLFIFLLISSRSFSADLPEGWREPTESELAKGLFRRQSLSRYTKVDADFNGDGKMDNALLLVSTKFDGEGLVVKLSSTDGYVWKILHKYKYKYSSEERLKPLLMGIALAPKEIHKTGCGKGYWKCAQDEPATVKLETVGLNYFLFNGRSSLFYWDEQTQAFLQVRLSN